MERTKRTMDDIRAEKVRIEPVQISVWQKLKIATVESVGAAFSTIVKEWNTDPREGNAILRPMLPEHVLEAIHEAADAAVNPTGYADDPAESDRRADQRTALELELRNTVTTFLNS